MPAHRGKRSSTHGTTTLDSYIKLTQSAATLAICETAFRRLIQDSDDDTGTTEIRNAISKKKKKKSKPRSRSSQSGSLSEEEKENDQSLDKMEEEIADMTRAIISLSLTWRSLKALQLDQKKEFGRGRKEIYSRDPLSRAEYMIHMNAKYRRDQLIFAGGFTIDLSECLTDGKSKKSMPQSLSERETRYWLFVAVSSATGVVNMHVREGTLTYEKYEEAIPSVVREIPTSSALVLEDTAPFNDFSTRRQCQERSVKLEYIPQTCFDLSPLRNSSRLI
ncbi:hypothetical protein SISNIDRAFT_487262 [Sistotremastrum niveocremeum HHB9708]|uniref:Tc1-like transposase DDE domain-containing protein n=1 Tax=Sistotremastrum niveocremeum HHB9708 TaxID=1314777 RepID=A0A164SL87_9AGAM|nr:hypothetical protein SISNIDRAFT_487262 [Sistotremastrum niveocremeum HHB9708]